MKEDDIFAIAVELSPSEREDYLREACGEDEALRKSVEELLAKHEEPGGILDQSLRRIDADFDPSSNDETATMDFREGPDGERILYFGDYELHGEIARGAMGVVFRAEQRSLKRIVAIKMIRSTMLTNEADVARFHTEAESAASLDHPNIVPIYEIGEHQDQHYFSMKLIEGGTVRGHLEELRKDPKATAQLMATVARAIQAAHQRGVLHRDLKPGNILIDESGEPHLTDFGLAKQMESASSATLSGQIMGTPSYMAPEQAEGGTKNLTTAADIYALGAILYELLTGQPPHKGESLIETLRLVATTEPTAPRTIDPGIDRDLETIALKCLSKDPSARYGSAQELAAELERWLRGEPIAARPTTSLEKLLKWIKRRPGLAALAALALLLLLTLGIGGPLAAMRQAELRKNADAAKALSIKRERETRSALARASLSLADAALREGDGRAMQRALETVPEDLRDSTWHYLFDQSDTSLTPLGEMDAESIAGDPSRPGVFAVSGTDRSVTILDVRSGRRLLNFTPVFSSDPKGESQDIILQLAFSPDGKRLAVGATDKRKNSGTIAGVVFYDPRNGRKLNEWETLRADELVFSPDGTKLLIRSDRRVQLRDGTDGSLLWHHPKRDRFSWPSFTSDSQFLILTTGSSFDVYNAGDGQLVRKFSRHLLGHTDATYTIALGSSGLIAQAVGGNSVTVIDSRTGDLVTRFQHPAGILGLRLLAFTPDGEQVVTCMENTDGRLFLKVWNARTGFPVRSLLGGKSGHRGLAVHPRSGELLVTGKYARAWDLTGSPPKWSSTGRYKGGMTFWGDDDTVITQTHDGRPAVQSLTPSGVTVHWTPPIRVHARQPNVSADGRYAALPGGQQLDTVLILHRSGGRIEEKVRLNGPSGQWNASFARLSPTGDQVVVSWKTQGSSPLHWFSCQTGEVAGEIERESITQIHDLGWHSEECLIGLVTTGALRASENSEEFVVSWDMTSGRIRRMASHPAEMDALAMEPGGGRFAEAGVDKKVRIRDAETLEVLQEFRAHDGPIVHMAWHPTRAILATTGSDWFHRIWDLETGNMLEELHGPRDLATSLVFSPTGKRLGSSDRNGVMRIWEPKSLQDGAESE